MSFKNLIIKWILRKNIIIQILSTSSYKNDRNSWGITSYIVYECVVSNLLRKFLCATSNSKRADPACDLPTVDVILEQVISSAATTVIKSKYKVADKRRWLTFQTQKKTFSRENHRTSAF